MNKRTLLTAALTTTGLFASAQPTTGPGSMIGMEAYTPTDTYSNVSGKIYVTSSGDYDYQVLDALDGAIYVLDLPVVYQELRRIVTLNGGNMDDGIVVEGSATGPTIQEITTGILQGDEYVFVRWDLPNGYHVYLNLQDLFCGIGVSLDPPKPE